MEIQLRAAQASGDVATILSLMAKTSEQKPSDFIKKTIGNILYLYYLYVENLRVRPKDLIDLADGLLYLDSRGFLEKQQYQQEMERARREQQRRCR